MPLAADAAPAPLPTLPDGVPHLASPDALPPGSTMDPALRDPENPNVSYLKDLWHAVQNQEISGKEALIMSIAQRGMNTPYPNQSPGPYVPTAPVGAPVPTAPVGAPGPDVPTGPVGPDVAADPALAAPPAPDPALPLPPAPAASPLPPAPTP